MVNNNFTAIVIVAIVVALVASFATASIVGNTIRVNPDKLGGYQVYIKAEIDKRLSNLATKEEVNEEMDSVLKEISSIGYQPKSCAIWGDVFSGKVAEFNLVKKDYKISINFLSKSEATLSVNGELTNKLVLGQSFKLTDGTLVKLKEINFVNYVNSPTDKPEQVTIILDAC